MTDKLITQCANARAAQKGLAVSSGEIRNAAITAMAERLLASSAYILAENAKDLENAEKSGTKPAMLDRLALTEARLEGIAASLGKVAKLEDPLGSGSVWTRPNGLIIRRVRVPLGVIAIIYEARPNVTADAAALCIKSGNAAILRGGSSALCSNLAISGVLRKAVASVGLDGDCIQLISDTSRESANSLMKLRGHIDLLIPRGGKSLIQSVVENATVPTVETGAGNCHIYVDESADIKMAVGITVNAKTQRPSVCNAAETLLVHKNAAEAFLPAVKAAMPQVELRGCPETKKIIDVLPVSEEDWGLEYNDYIMAVKIVGSTAEAIAHINKYSTGHSEAIVTENLESAELFRSGVDSAAVYVNASTRFTDGEEFGFGAEIGISTQKLHARGPMGLNELTCDKYLIDGRGQVR